MTNEEVRLKVDEIHSKSVTLRHYLVNGSWFQFYDDNSPWHQVTKLEYNFNGTNENVWVHKGYVEVPTHPTDDEREDAYYQFFNLLHNGKDA